MATKGVSIDINNHKNYETRSGVQVKKIRCLDNTLLYPLEVTLEDGSIKAYTMEGFLIANAIHDCDLQLKQREVKKRKVVQISTCMSEEELITTVLCDDGTIFYMGNNGVWSKEIEIPQD
jgi:hypothetical protein